MNLRFARWRDLARRGIRAILPNSSLLVKKAKKGGGPASAEQPYVEYGGEKLP